MSDCGRLPLKITNILVWTWLKPKNQLWFRDWVPTRINRCNITKQQNIKSVGNNAPKYMQRHKGEILTWNVKYPGLGSCSFIKLMVGWLKRTPGKSIPNTLLCSAQILTLYLTRIQYAQKHWVKFILKTCKKTCITHYSGHQVTMSHNVNHRFCPRLINHDHDTMTINWIFGRVTLKD